jgi:hypothetical protein
MTVQYKIRNRSNLGVCLQVDQMRGH